MTNTKIDFVITWVDGNDEEWIKQKNSFLAEQGRITDVDSSKERFRDWGTLKYIFRGIEKFAPWVNSVFLITNGQVPEWINLQNDKLKLITHDQYIPADCLPTFSSHPIELNLNRIKDLQEQFVLFNDDTFITNHVQPTDFFVDGLPCDSAVLSPIISSDKSDFAHILINNIQIINMHFNKRKVLNDNLGKFLNLKYGLQNLRTINMLPWKHIPGFYNPHLPYSFLKSMLEELWEVEGDKLHETSTHRFRDNFHDVSPWLLRYWQICSGKFYPRSIRFGKKFNYSSDNLKIYDAIKRQDYKTICLNDDETCFDFEKEKEKTAEAFETILGEKSSFEI